MTRLNFMICLMMMVSFFSISANADVKLENEITETVNALNSKNLFKEAIPAKIKGLSERGLKNIKNLLQSIGDKPMPYFSQYGNTIAIYSENSKTTVTILSHSPFVFSVADEIHNYKNFEAFLEDFKIPSGKQSYSFLINTLIQQAQAAATLGHLAMGSLITYGVYRYGKGQGELEARRAMGDDDGDGETSVTVINQAQAPSVMTMQTLKERKQEQYRAFVDTLSNDVVHSFPQSTCQSKNLFPKAQVSYKKQNNVLTVSLKPDGEDTTAEFRFNELTGGSLNAICHKDGKCEEFRSSDLGAEEEAKQSLFTSSRAAVNNKIAKLRAQFEKIKADYQKEEQSEKDGSITVDKFMADNKIAYAKPYPVADIMKQLLDPKAIEQYRQAYIKSKHAEIESIAKGRTGETLIAFWNKKEFDFSPAADPKTFPDYVKKTAESCLGGEGFCTKGDYNLISIVQDRFMELLEKNRPIAVDDKSKKLLKLEPSYKLSKADKNRFREISGAAFDKIYEDRRAKKEAFAKKLEAIQAQTGRARDNCVREYEEREIKDPITVTECALTYAATLFNYEISSRVHLSQMASSLKDFGACCTNTDCNASVTQKRTSLNRAQQEMVKRVVN